jgi:hypothetical protein
MWKNDGQRGDTRTKRPIFLTAKFHARPSGAVLCECAARNSLEISLQNERRDFPRPNSGRKSLVQLQANCSVTQSTALARFATDFQCPAAQQAPRLSASLCATSRPRIASFSPREAMQRGNTMQHLSMAKNGCEIGHTFY